MICPRCAHDNSKVVKTLKSLTNMRWRKCKHCDYTWLTEEKPLADKELVAYMQYIADPKEQKCD